MKLWFQIVVSIGILAVSAAAISYTWQVWRTYELEYHAEEICKFIVDDNFKEAGDLEKWLGRRSCINDAMGKFTSK
jgi:hypothetical protein